MRVLLIDDERLLHAFNVTKDSLNVGGPTFGIARYFGDKYCRVDQEKPGNPWFIASLWIAQFIIAKAESTDGLEEAKEIIENVAKFSTSHMLSEQINPNTGENISATHLVWSHAEFVRTIIEYNKKFNILSNNYKNPENDL